MLITMAALKAKMQALFYSLLLIHRGVATTDGFGLWNVQLLLGIVLP